MILTNVPVPRAIIVVHAKILPPTLPTQWQLRSTGARVRQAGKGVDAILMLTIVRGSRAIMEGHAKMEGRMYTHARVRPVLKTQPVQSRRIPASAMRTTVTRTPTVTTTVPACSSVRANPATKAMGRLAQISMNAQVIRAETVARVANPQRTVQFRPGTSTARALQVG